MDTPQQGKHKGHSNTPDTRPKRRRGLVQNSSNLLPDVSFDDLDPLFDDDPDPLPDILSDLGRSPWDKDDKLDKLPIPKLRL